MAIDSAEVRRIAGLAQLDLDEPLVEVFREQLQSILDHVARLDDLDVDAVAPTEHPLQRLQPPRSDRERTGLSSEEALSNAPQAVDGLFRVPRVLKG